VTKQRTAASFTFFPSIPRAWEVREYLRVAAALKDEPDEKPHQRIERAIVALLEQNPEIRKQVVYGLTAIALQRVGMLKQARSSVCTLRERLDDGTYEVLSNNHRFHRLPTSVVDPLVRFFEKQGKTVECYKPYRIRPYPVAVAAGVLAQFKSKQERDQRQTRDETQRWFDYAIHRICRRLSLPPDLWGFQQGSTDRTSRRYKKMRRQLEGLLRVFTKRMQEESEKYWKGYLVNSLQREFPHMPEDDAVSLVERLENEHGPQPPRSLHKQRRKVKMIEPELGGSGNWTH